MELKVGLTMDVFAQLIRAKGTLRERGSVTGRDCYAFETVAGTYTVPNYEGGWSPIDFATFTANGASSSRPMHAPQQVLEAAVNDREIVALLSQATIEWKPAKNVW